MLAGQTSCKYSSGGKRTTTFFNHRGKNFGVSDRPDPWLELLRAHTKLSCI